VPEAVLVIVRRGLGVEDGYQVRRPGDRGGALHGSEIGDAGHANLAVRPSLAGDPIDCVTAILGFIDTVVEAALRRVPTPNVLDNEDIPVANKTRQRREYPALVTCRRLCGPESSVPVCRLAHVAVMVGTRPRGAACHRASALQHPVR
jgi:hypothetical protein